jgi:hypothetical protein
MIEVCFNFAEAGVIKHVLGKKNSDIFILYEDLDVGDISNKLNESRFNYCLSEKERKKLVKYYEKSLSEVIKKAKKGETIRVWRSNAPYSMCGFLYLTNELEGIDCNVIDNNLNNLPSGAFEEREESSWYRVSNEVVEKYQNSGKELTKEERSAFSCEWDRMVEENAPLRINEKGKLVGVKEDYFDDYIEHSVDEEEFSMSKIVGYAMGKCERDLSDRFIGSRVEKMISDGKFEVVEGPVKRRGNWSKKLRRVSSL